MRTQGDVDGDDRPVTLADVEAARAEADQARREAEAACAKLAAIDPAAADHAKREGKRRATVEQLRRDADEYDRRIVEGWSRPWHWGRKAADARRRARRLDGSGGPQDAPPSPGSRPGRVRRSGRARRGRSLLARRGGRGRSPGSQAGDDDDPPLHVDLAAAPAGVPSLVIVVPLEGTPSVYLDADSLEDERALLAWLDAFERVTAHVAADVERLRREAA
jgi:hypothetical protein